VNIANVTFAETSHTKALHRLNAEIAYLENAWQCSGAPAAASSSSSLDMTKYRINVIQQP
jgi:hypothetical protein